MHCYSTYLLVMSPRSRDFLLMIYSYALEQYVSILEMHFRKYFVSLKSFHAKQKFIACIIFIVLKC